MGSRSLVGAYIIICLIWGDSRSHCPIRYKTRSQKAKQKSQVKRRCCLLELHWRTIVFSVSRNRQMCIRATRRIQGNFHHTEEGWPSTFPDCHRYLMWSSLMWVVGVVSARTATAKLCIVSRPTAVQAANFTRTAYPRYPAFCPPSSKTDDFSNGLA